MSYGSRASRRACQAHATRGDHAASSTDPGHGWTAHRFHAGFGIGLETTAPSARRGAASGRWLATCGEPALPFLCPTTSSHQHTRTTQGRRINKDVASYKNLVNLEDVLGEEPVNLVKRACQRSKELTDEIARLRQVVSPYQASASSSTASASAAN